jgi:hypothetical protein
VHGIGYTPAWDVFLLPGWFLAVGLPHYSCYLMAKCQGKGHVMMHQLPRLPWMLAYMLHPQGGDDSPDVSTERLALTPDCEAFSNVFPKSYSTFLFQ